MLTAGTVASILFLLAPGSFNRSYDRGIFVYGDLSLDFRKEVEIYGRVNRLRDCSTDRYFCAKGDIFNIVLPKDCRELRLGAVWRVGNLETRVLGSQKQTESLHRRFYIPADHYYLQTNVRPEIVYTFSADRGLTQVFHDPTGGTDFVALAREGRIEAFQQESSGNPARRSAVKSLLTFDTFAECANQR